ncbi:MAG TPA: hypothetical protein VJU15_08745 [Gemmatimonadales bacterium]|nr:hypothetical protein [Gemmatimonadales bacterium]
MSRTATARALALASLALARPAFAQYVPEPGAISTGVEARYYRFGQDLGVKSLGQFAVPLAVVFPIGRVTVDAGAWLAATSLTRLDGARETVTGLTDTQIRAAYVLGSDALVLTAMVNLPTGAQKLSAADYAVLSAASSSFLAFPVNAYGSGASATLGAAAAFRAGSWNLGLAGSARISDEFTPFEDADGSFTYKSGLEGRVRFGADHLVGNGKLAIGLTFSTFSDDEFANGSGATGVYRPGKRLISEVSYTTLIRSALVTGYVWDFFRTSGDSAGTSVPNRDNLFAAGIATRIPMGPTFNLEPGAELRFANPIVGNAVLLEMSLATRIRLSSRYTLIPVGKIGIGRLEEPDPGFGHSIRGAGLSVFLRWQL